MKKAIAWILIGILVLGTLTVRAENGVRVEINDEEVVFDVPPQIVKDRTFVPMRAVFEGLNAEVLWDAATKTVVAKRGETTVNITVGTAVLYKNGMPYLLEEPPFVQADRVLIPLRAVAESFDCDVQWEAHSRTVVITDAGEPKKMLSSEEVAEKIAPCVFRIDVFDQKEFPVSHGSGFFIREDGVAVTNYHVIADGYCADAHLEDKSVFPITHVLAYDEKTDIAIIRVDKAGIQKTVEAFPAVEIADSRHIKRGQAVYAMGNPSAYSFTFSSGVVSFPERTKWERQYIQMTAPISHGCSGGILADAYGDAVGILSAVDETVQGANFAVPMHLLEMLNWENAKGETFYDFATKNVMPKFEIGEYKMEIKVGESIEIPFTVSETGRDKVTVSADYTEAVDWDMKEASTQPATGQAFMLRVSGVQPGRVNMALSAKEYDTQEVFVIKVVE